MEGDIAGDGGGPLTRQWLWVSSASLCAGVALFSYRYLAGMGPVPEVIATNNHLSPWLGIHVGAAATALLIGPLQFLPRLRARRRALHRWCGRIYVTACLIGAMAALPLALGASTGPITTAGFGTLAILWVLTTWLAWRYAPTAPIHGAPHLDDPFVSPSLSRRSPCVSTCRSRLPFRSPSRRATGRFLSCAGSRIFWQPNCTCAEQVRSRIDDRWGIHD